MSFWDRYLAPGDIRAQRQELVSAAKAAETRNEDHGLQKIIPPVQRIDPAHRARRQNTLFFGGLFFTGLSLLVTRRALRRRQLPNPSQFSQSNAEPPRVEGSLEAAEALGLATLNVFSIAMATAGGMMKYFDVADLEDMREGVRRGIGYDVYGGDAQADKEMEAWVADILSRKDGLANLKGEITEKLMELDKKEAERKTKESQR